MNLGWKGEIGKTLKAEFRIEVLEAGNEAACEEDNSFGESIDA